MKTFWWLANKLYWVHLDTWIGIIIYSKMRSHLLYQIHNVTARKRWHSHNRHIKEPFISDSIQFTMVVKSTASQPHSCAHFKASAFVPADYVDEECCLLFSLIPAAIFTSLSHLFSRPVLPVSLRQQLICIKEAVTDTPALEYWKQVWHLVLVLCEWNCGR